MGPLIQAPYYNHSFQELLQNYGKSMGLSNPCDFHIAYEQAQHCLNKQIREPAAMLYLINATRFYLFFPALIASIFPR